MSSHFKDSGALDHPMENVDSSQSKPTWQQRENEEKAAAIQEEIKRMNRLPATSAYASHRLRVLNKIMHLLSVQRTISQDEELELLFAGLHL